MNWQKLIGDLIESGMTQAQIAESAKCTQAFISDLYRGKKKSCDYEIGSALVRLEDNLKKKAA